MVKMGRGKPQQKRWICLFTCLSVRAIHLELCSGLDIDSFMNALTRFIGRRGVPSSIVSDNGTNFHGADNELKRLFEMFQSDRIQEKCSQKRIEWKFNPPGGPHHGGVYEAMIKAAKTALKDILFKKDLTDEEMQTALVSVEGMLNQRPLSYVGSGLEETVLTPNHFIHGSLGGMLAPDVLDGTPTFQKRWRLVQELLKEVWNRWLREWVTELNKRKKWQTPMDNLKVGDIVLVIDAEISKSRGDFPLARVTETHTGPDGLVRTCKVKTADGRVNTKIIQRLAKIESSK
jgi:transposase InsO family protein